VEARYGVIPEEIKDEGVLLRRAVAVSNLIDTAGGLPLGVIIKRQTRVDGQETDTPELLGDIQGKWA
jgi:hypothetical protein